MSAIEGSDKTSAGKIAAIVGCGCAGLILVGVLVIGGIFFIALQALKHSDAYTESIAAVESNADATTALGTPVKAGLFPTGNISLNNGEGVVAVTIPVSGPNGDGTVIVKGKKPPGSPVWIYETWELVVDGRPEPILLSR